MADMSAAIEPRQQRHPKSAAKEAAIKQSFKPSLWPHANKLRGLVESSEYKHMLLSLISLKFISDTFNLSNSS